MIRELLLLTYSILLSVNSYAEESKLLPPFIQSAAEGDLKAVTQTITKGVDVNSADEQGLTALHHAAMNNHASVCAVLLKNGAVVDQKSRGGRTALFSAAFAGAIDSTKLLLDNQANINVQLGGKMTPLNIALHREYSDLALLLIERGADVTLANGDKIAPMDVVFERQMDALFFPIFDAMPINPKARAQALSRYLELAVCLDYFNLYKILLDLSPEPTSDKDLFFRSIECGSGTIIEHFLKNGRSLTEVRPGSLWTALHFFAQTNNTEHIGSTLESGLSVDSADARRWTPLHVAAYLGCIEVARILLDAGASVDTQEEAGSTPLHLAAERGNTEMIRLLMASGASAGSVDFSKHTPLDIAILTGHGHLQNVFPLGTATINVKQYDISGDVGRLREAIVSGNSETVRRVLVSTRSDVNMPDKFGMTLLHYAANLGDTDSIGHLFNANADPNSVNELTSWTPLLYAANGDYTNVAKKLLMAGANANVQDVQGWTALHVASFRGNKELVEALHVAGADETLENKNGDVPSDIAGALDQYLAKKALSSYVR
jgi:ankyrin repeat protein